MRTGPIPLMHRRSDEVVAAVALAAIAELRRHQEGREPEVPDSVVRAVRQVRAGVLPRQQYDADRGPDDPPYDGLPAIRLDEDRILWLVTQALTDTGF